MEFLTLHQLSRELDKPEKVIRYRFNILKFEGGLIEGEDYIRDEYVDEQHFVYKINPLSFMQKTGFKIVPKPEEPISNAGDQSGTNLGTNEENLGTNNADFGTNIGTREEELVTKPAPNLEQIAYDKEMTNDFISVLKEQLRVKDKQLADANAQVKDLQDINNMAMGEVVKLNRTIRQLADPKRDPNTESGGYQNTNIIDADIGTKETEFGTNGYQSATPDDDEQIKKETYPTQ